MNDVFISYSRRDKVFTQKLYETLKAVNRMVWADWDSIPAASDWDAEIKQGIQETNSVLFVLSPEWIKSNECRKELVHAVAMGKRLFPILYLPVDPNDVPPELAKINWVYMRDTDDFDKAFQTLCSAMDTDLEWIKTHTRIQVRALEWERKNRSASFALRGEDLTEGEQFIAGAANKSPVPTALQSEYILASRKDATKRQRQTLAGVTIALMVSIVLGVVAFLQRQEALKQATIAQSQVLAVNIKLDASKVLHNLLLGIESFRMVKDLSQSDKVIAEQGLRDTLSQVNGIPLVGHDDSIHTLAFSPNGRWLATGSDDKTIRLWDMQNISAKSNILSEHNENNHTLAFSPDSRWLATGSQDKTVHLWDMQNLTAKPIVLTGHEGSIHTLAFSPDGRWLATGSEDKTVHLWDTQNFTAKPIVLSGHEGSIRTLAFSPNGRWLATGSDDKTVCLWDMQNPTAKSIVLRKVEYFLNSLVFSPEGRWLATYDDGTVRLWDMESLSADPVVLKGNEGGIGSLTFSPHGRWLALQAVNGHDLGVASVWDMQDRSAESTNFEPEKDVFALAFSPDDRWMAISSSDSIALSTTRLLDPQNPYAQTIILRGHESYIYALAFSPDGRWLASGSVDKMVRLWDFESFIGEPIILQGYNFAFSTDGRQVTTVGDDVDRMWEIQESTDQPLILRKQGDHIYNVTFSPDSHWLVTNTEDKTAHLWDMQNSSGAPTLLLGPTNNVKFSSDSRWLVTGSNKDKTVYLWDMQNPSSNPLTRNGVEYDFYDALSPDGHWLVTESVNGVRSNRTARLWNLQDPTTKPIILNKPGDVVPTFAFSADSHWLLIIADAVHLRDLQNRSAKPILLYESKRDSTAYEPYFSPDGDWLVWVGEDKTTRLWNMMNITGDPILLGGNQLSFNYLTFSPDGHWLVTRSDDNINHLWDMHNSDKNPVILDECENYYGLFFSPEGRWLAANCVDSTIRVLDLQKPTAEPLILHGPDISIVNIAVSPDDRWFAVSNTESISLWNMENPTATPIRLGDEGYAYQMAFSPDGHWLAASGLQSISLWNMNYDYLLEMACKVVGRNFTRSEWAKYFPNEEYRKTCEHWALEPEITSTPTAAP